MNRYLPWQAISLVIASLVFFPLVTLLVLAFSPETASGTGIWSHLLGTVFSDYVISSLELMAGVTIVTLSVGIGCAWLLTQYTFFGSRILNWALLLPLAMPTYIIAYSYTGLLDVAGPVQRGIRDSFGLQFGEYWFPEIRSMGGAIFVMSFVLYPYVYLLARASFLQQSKYLRDAGQLLGLSRRMAFFKINLPVARPAIVAGVSLALMETLADYGAVSYFGINTFTTGIFRTWYGLDSVAGAAQLALVLLAFVIVLLVIERQSRQRARYHSRKSLVPAQPKKLAPAKSGVALLLCLIPLMLGFVVPVTQLVIWAIDTREQLNDPGFWLLVEHTLVLATTTALIALALALSLAYGHRVARSTLTRYAKRIAGLGYAVPGIVIAVGVLIPLARLDNQIDAWFRANLDVSTGLIISGTTTALIIAYLVRFLAISLNTVDSGLAAIGRNMDQVARSLGTSSFDLLRRVHIPIIRASLLTAVLIVFVEVMKELPATLILRPFNFNTLAVRAYELANDEQLADASLVSLAIVLAGLIPVILLTKAIGQSRQDSE